MKVIEHCDERGLHYTVEMTFEERMNMLSALVTACVESKAMADNAMFEYETQGQDEIDLEIYEANYHDYERTNNLLEDFQNIEHVDKKTCDVE